ncbi:hypothetical protein SAMD00023353_2001460 [Rosellinia necatrix]|uniref:Uncharacterized protein n=1 Tax=Rosellinia necatrix TaxID=77044 RepID=A0A1S8A7P8_ROSNE|nr:hypothetical protein SAMD00023353_2001460 [Rosellinia necatrix]
MIQSSSGLSINTSHNRAGSRRAAPALSREHRARVGERPPWLAPPGYAIEPRLGSPGTPPYSRGKFTPRGVIDTVAHGRPQARNHSWSMLTLLIPVCVFGIRPDGTTALHLPALRSAGGTRYPVPRQRAKMT